MKLWHWAVVAAGIWLIWRWRKEDERAAWSAGQAEAMRASALANSMAGSVAGGAAE